jgi:hypothetical protein
VAEALAKLPQEAQQRLLALLSEKGKLTAGDVREARQVDRQGGADDLDLDDLELDDDLVDFGDNALPRPKPTQRMSDDVAGILEKLVALSMVTNTPTKKFKAELAVLAAEAHGALVEAGRALSREGNLS